MTSSLPKRRARTAALALLAAHNLIQNEYLNERGYVTGNLVMTAGMVALGRHAELDREDMGLGAGDLRKGLGVGVAAMLASVAFVAGAPNLPASSALLRDERAVAGSLPEAVRRGLTRFPLGTAVFEEVAFRGVLAPLLAAGRDHSNGDLASATIFALWHLVPTHHALIINRVGSSPRTRLFGTLLGAAAAGVAGYGLSWIRRRTGSLLAPWLIHSSINAGTYLGVVLARNRR